MEGLQGEIIIIIITEKHLNNLLNSLVDHLPYHISATRNRQLIFFSKYNSIVRTKQTRYNPDASHYRSRFYKDIFALSIPVSPPPYQPNNTHVQITAREVLPN